MSRTTLSRLPGLLRPLSSRPLSTTAGLFADKSYNSSSSADHKGSTSAHHVTNSKDELDIHSSASASGQRARESGDPTDSVATSRKGGEANKKAEKETKAPGIVIGMNDERGAKGA